MYYLHNAQTYQYMGEVMAILEMFNKQFHQEIAMITT